MRIYTEERYRMMHDFYGAFHVSVRQRYRLRFLVCTVLAILAILLKIWLFTLYHECTAISSGNSHPASLYVPYRYDNGNDSVQGGSYRIVNKGRIGYADEHGNTLIEPRFAFGFPFENGKAKVTDTGEQKKNFPVRMGNTTIGKAMIGITSTGKGKGLNKSPKTALNPTFQPPTCQTLAGQARSRQALSGHPVHATFPPKQTSKFKTYSFTTT